MSQRSWKQNRSRGTSRNTSRPLGGQLRVESLENRSMLSGSPLANLLQIHSVPAAYEVVAPEQANAGAATFFKVIARDANGHQAIGYNGSASLTESGATTADGLPTSINFHFGEAWFKATFTSTGVATFTATETDTTNATPVSGVGSTTISDATVATRLIVTLPAHETPGRPVYAVVEAVDAAGHRVPSYTGTVTLSSSTDSGATLPEAYQFTAADKGVHRFRVNFSASGEQTLTATDDQAENPLTGSVSTNLADPTAVTHFEVRLPEHIQQGVATSVIVMALNANNQPVPSYTGTVSFAVAGATTSADVTLPSDYTFTSGRWWKDNGAHRFTVTFNTTGLQSFVVTDSNGNTSAVMTTDVYAAPVATSLRIIAPETIQEGRPVTVIVQALDASNHVLKTYTNAVTLTGDGGVTVTGPDSSGSLQGRLKFKVTAPTGTAGTTITLSATDAALGLSASTTVNVIAPTTGRRGLLGRLFG